MTALLLISMAFGVVSSSNEPANALRAAENCAVPNSTVFGAQISTTLSAPMQQSMEALGRNENTFQIEINPDESIKKDNIETILSKVRSTGENILDYVTLGDFRKKLTEVLFSNRPASNVAGITFATVCITVTA